MARFHFPTYCLALLILMTATCCQRKTDDPTPQAPQPVLPAITQVGANTMGCAVNGQPWLPTFTAAPGQGVTVRAGGGQLLLLGYQDGSAGPTSIRVELSYGFHGVGTYSLFYAEGTDNQVVYTKEREQKAYFADSLGCNELIISCFDSLQGILAGRFCFRGVAHALRGATSPPDTVLITDGRFDLKLR